mgnify:FL=1
MWKFFTICLSFAIFTGIALNIISSSIQNKQDQLLALNKEIEKKNEELKIINTEWSFLTHPKKITKLVEENLGMLTRDNNQTGNIEIVSLRGSAWKMGKGISNKVLIKSSMNNNSLKEIIHVVK